MSLSSVATAMGVPLHALEELLAGRSSAAISARLRTGSELVQDFIDGQANEGVAAAMTVPTAFAQELRDRIGKDGAVGLLIGLCITLRR
jgi:hypothetical protein